MIIVILAIGGILIFVNQKSLSPNTQVSGKFVSENNSALASNAVSGSLRVINLRAVKFSYDPGTITVKKGEHVRIVIDNSDTTHGIVIPSLGVSGIDSMEFTANTSGTYEFKCPTFCGSGHRNMTGTLVVEE